MTNPDILRAQGQALIDAASDYDAAGRAIGFVGDSEPATFLRARAAVFMTAAGATPAHTPSADDDLALAEAVIEAMVEISTAFRMDGGGVHRMRELLISKPTRDALRKSNSEYAARAVRAAGDAFAAAHPSVISTREDVVGFLRDRADEEHSRSAR